MKFARKALTALLALAMLAGCSSAPKEPAANPENPSEGEQTPVQGGTYIIRQATDPGSLTRISRVTIWRPTRRPTSLTGW